MKFLLFLLSLISCHSHTSSTLEVVSYVDLTRYQGTWYEIAKYENEFQEDCLGTRATYTLEDSSVSVLNECQTRSGKTGSAEGQAFITDKTTNAKLKVSFVPLLKSLGLFAGDYWIIELDDQYEYVVVGHPERKYLWILSRSTSMSSATYNKLLERLNNIHHYDIEKLKVSGIWNGP